MTQVSYSNIIYDLRRTGLDRQVNSILAQGLKYLGANFLGVAVAALNGILLARRLGPSGTGTLSLLAVTASLSAYVATLGLNRASIFFMGNQSEAKSVLANSLLYTVVSGYALTGLWILFSDSLSDALGLTKSPQAIPLASFLPLCYLAQTFANDLLIGQRQFFHRNVMSLAYEFLGLTGTAGLVYYARMGVNGAVVSILLASGISAAYGFFFAIRLTRPRPGDLDAALCVKSLVYGLKLHVGNIFQMLTLRSDMFIVNYFIGQAGVGLYAVAVSLAELLLQLPVAVTNVMFPSVSDKKWIFMSTGAAMIGRLLVAVMTLSGVILGVISYAFIPGVFGDDFGSAWPPLLALIPGIIALGVHKTAIIYLMGKGYPQYMTYTGITGLLASVLLDLALIPWAGIIGTAFASTASYILVAVVSSHYFCSLGKVPLTDLFIPRWYELRELRRLFLPISGMVSKRVT